MTQLLQITTIAYRGYPITITERHSTTSINKLNNTSCIRFPLHSKPIVRYGVITLEQYGHRVGLGSEVSWNITIAITTNNWRVSCWPIKYFNKIIYACRVSFHFKVSPVKLKVNGYSSLKP